MINKIDLQIIKNGYLIHHETIETPDTTFNYSFKCSSYLYKGKAENFFTSFKKVCNTCYTFKINNCLMTFKGCY